NLGLQPRRGYVDTRVLGAHGIANPREHVSNWIGHTFQPLSCTEHLARSTPARCTARYQLLFVTPVTSPSSASLRKQSRHNANLRIYARGRPQRRHRFRSRILNFGVFSSFAIFAVVAMSVSALILTFSLDHYAARLLCGTSSPRPRR